MLFGHRASTRFAVVLAALAAATLAVDGCSDGGAASGEAPPPSSPCSVGSLRWISVASRGAAGGDVVAFADCLDAGTIPPLANEGACAVHASEAFDPAAAPRTFIDHGTVAVTQDGTALDAKVAPNDVKATFATPLAAGKAVRAAVGASASLGSASLEAPAGHAVTFSAPVGPTPRTKALTVTWQGGAAGESIELALRAASGRIVRCQGKAETGTLEVPAAVLAEMPAGEANLAITTVTGTTGQGNATSLRIQVPATATGAAAVALE